MKYLGVVLAGALAGCVIAPGAIINAPIEANATVNASASVDVSPISGPPLTLTPTAPATVAPVVSTPAQAPAVVSVQGLEEIDLINKWIKAYSDRGEKSKLMIDLLRDRILSINKGANPLTNYSRNKLEEDLGRYLGEDIGSCKIEVVANIFSPKIEASKNESVSVSDNSQREIDAIFKLIETYLARKDRGDSITDVLSKRIADLKIGAKPLSESESQRAWDEVGRALESPENISSAHENLIDLFHLKQQEACP